MKNLPLSFCRSTIAVLLFLIVPVLSVYAQQAEVSDETQPKQLGTQIFNPVSLRENSVSLPKLETKHLFLRTVTDEGNSHSVNHPTVPPQSSAAGGYVFPLNIGGLIVIFGTHLVH